MFLIEIRSSLMFKYEEKMRLPVIIRPLLYSLLLASIFEVGTCVASAQARDHGHRVDRLDRLRDRNRPPARDRIVDRPLLDRPITRDEPDPPIRDTLEETPPEAEEASRIIDMEDEGYRVRRGEILALNLSDAARREALAEGLNIIRETRLGPEQTLTVLKGDGFDLPTEVIERLRTADPDGVFTPNHIYSPSGELEDSTGRLKPLTALTGHTNEAHRIGMIDGIPDANHPFLAEFLTDSTSFGDAPISISVHGTAVALRLFNLHAGHLPGTGLELYAANVLSDEDHASATAEALTEALVWQQGNQVHVLNISLAGPPNEIVEFFTQQFLETGGHIVAAVGNGGPLSKNIYPAAYEGVIGVSASTEAGDIFSLATRGAHVDVAAPGVNIFINGLSENETWSGTSYAAPYAAIWLLAADRYGLTLTENCQDAGAPGRDNVYGCGLINLDQLPRLQLTAKQ